MDKKILALIIVAVAVVGVYGAFYAAISAIFMPMDLNEFKNELNAMPPGTGINESSINSMESNAALIESSPSLTNIPQDQRTAMANQMANVSIPPEVSNPNWSRYKSYNNDRAWKYDLIFKGNVSGEIRSITGNYENLTNLSNQIQSIQQKMATDYRNGDNKAYADDMRNMANTMKQYNTAMAKLRTDLQRIVNDMSG